MPIRCSMPPIGQRKKVVKKILDWAMKEFGGSGDLDKQDAVHIVDQLDATYGRCEDVLANTVKVLRDHLDIIDPTWIYRGPPVATTMPHPPAAGATETLRLSPIHLGYAEAFSDKGKSKMINIFECIQNFLEKPYDSVENPLLVRFGPECIVGHPIP